MTTRSLPILLSVFTSTLALFGACSSVTFAQQGHVTLDQAISLAVKNNRTLQIARVEMDKADYQVAEAIGSALPNVTASGTYTRAIKKQVFFLPDFMNPGSGLVTPIEIGSDHSLQFGLTATQTLFNAAVITGVGTARTYQKASRELYRESWNRTVMEVKRAFYGVLYMDRVREMMRASLKNAEDNLANVRAFNRQGLVSDYDLIRADVQVENIRPVVAEAERNAVLALNAFRMTLGVPPDAEISPTGDMSAEEIDPQIIEHAEARMKEFNAQLRALDYQTTVNEEIIDIYRAEYLPTISAFGNYFWQDQKDNLGRFGINELVGSSQVGLTVSLNLFNGLQTSSRVGQAKVEYQKMVETRRSAEDAMLTNLRNVLLRLEEARTRIAAQKRTVEQAEKGYAIATTRYSAGTGTQLEINDADLALMRARVNRIQAVYDYNIARAELEALLSLATPSDLHD